MNGHSPSDGRSSCRGVGRLRDSADRGRAPARDEDVPARSFRPFEMVTINNAVIVEN